MAKLLREHGTHDDKSRFWTSKIGAGSCTLTLI